MTTSFVFVRVILPSEALIAQRGKKFEFLKMSSRYTDNPERELKLRNVQLLRQSR